MVPNISRECFGCLFVLSLVTAWYYVTNATHKCARSMTKVGLLGCVSSAWDDNKLFDSRAHLT